MLEGPFKSWIKEFLGWLIAIESYGHLHVHHHHLHISCKIEIHVWYLKIVNKKSPYVDTQGL